MLNITIHASEPPDLELISDALAHGAHRIGHGVRLRADTNLVDADDAASVRARFDVGYNADNRPMSNVMPSSELHAVARAHSLTTVEMKRLATNAMRSSFAPTEVRRRIVAEQTEPAH